MYLGYNTNGFAHHRLEDAIRILAELGYRGVALTPDVQNFYHPNADHTALLATIRALKQEYRLEIVWETGARFTLDPRRKHQPTLISPTCEERELRRESIRSHMYFAAQTGTDIVSFWSGTPIDDALPSQIMTRLVDECRYLADDAVASNCRLAFEPEPGMFIDTMDKFAELHARVDHPRFGLTLDVGHLVCLGELPIRRPIHQWKDRLWNVHIEDMMPGVHDHLFFGKGRVDFHETLTALNDIQYAGGVFVELSRHSHDAVETARKSIRFLNAVLQT